MVLHILSDDKFTDYVIDQFSNDDMQSDLVVIPSGAGHSFKRCDKVRVISYPSSQFVELLSILGGYSGIVLHGLFWPFCEEIIKAAPHNVKIAWYFWGGELYCRSEIANSFIAPITNFLYRLHTIKNNTQFKSWQLPLDLYKRIDYCITSEVEEYEFAKEYTKSNMQFIWYTCYSLEETLGDVISMRSGGNNVLFCNSAALENNMFDATLRLQKLAYKKHLRDRHVVMPLSYGSPWIRNLMLKLGPICFKKFVPLITFLPREEYNRIMLDCSTLILPYHSPAGQGNIITALWLGMRVYLSEKSIAFKYFKRIGIKIYSFENDFVKYGCEKLSDDIVDHNKNILLKVYCKEQVYLNAKNLISILESNNATE